MIIGYMDWFVSFVGNMISWMSGTFLMPNVSLLGFIIAVNLLLIFIGGILIR